MHACEVGGVGQRRVPLVQRQVAVRQRRQHGGQPLGRLGVAVRRPMVQHVGMGVEGQAHDRP
jgi:hypothetical protein